MKFKQAHILIFFTCLFELASNSLFAQNNTICLEEVIALEELNSFRKDTAIDRKNIYMSYTIKATNWDDETSVSNVKLYRKGNYTHFFSEQATIYVDDKEALIIVPSQKLIILNSISKELNSRKLSDEFYDMRQDFLESCELVSCETTNKIKTLVLKVDNTKVDESIKIRRMTYSYNNDEKKITSIKMNYDEDYKLKQFQILYKDLSLTSAYKFFSAKSLVMDKNGNLNAKYKDYELMDNRGVAANKTSRRK
jgi:hypothetical protein